MGLGALRFVFAYASTFAGPSRSSSEHPTPPRSLHALLIPSCSGLGLCPVRLLCHLTLIFSVNSPSSLGCRLHPRSGVLPHRSLPPYRSTWPRPPRPRHSPSLRLSLPPQRPRPSAVSPLLCQGGRSR